MGVKVRERDGAWWLFIDYKGRRKQSVSAPERQDSEQQEQPLKKFRPSSRSVRRPCWMKPGIPHSP
jgi:hypothetical protein